MPYRPRGSGPVANAIDPAEIEMDRKREMLAKVKIRRENIMGNRGAVKDGDPSKHYCWVNRNEARQNWFLADGYTLCHTKTLSTEDATAATLEKKERVRRDGEKRGWSEKKIEAAVASVAPVVRWPTTDWEREDGTHVRGDVILYEIDKDEYEAIQFAEQTKNWGEVDKNQDLFADFLRRQDVNVPLYKPREAGAK